MPPKTVTYRRISVANIENDVAAAFRPAANQITSLIIQSADASGKLNLRPEQQQTLVDRVGSVVLGLFVGPDKKNAFASDGVTALAPFPQVLNNWYVKTVATSVAIHHNQMRRALPDDLYSWLGQARAPRAEMTALQAILESLRVLRPGFSKAALDDYQRMHTWVDKNGYKLSGRIWRNGTDIQDRMERLLTDLMGQGQGALPISRQMEQFLLPGRAALRTRQPYGTDASYYAMRLARTEIAFAANRAAYTSALLNPFVETIDIARSPQGDPTCPICPQYSTIDINQNRVADPYPIGDAPIPVFHSHCQCRLQSNVGQTPDQVIADLRDWMDQGNDPPITPVNDNLILLLILGPILLALLRQLQRQS